MCLTNISEFQTLCSALKTESKPFHITSELKQCNKINHATWPIYKYSTVQYSTVQYSTVQYSTVQYSTHIYLLHHDFLLLKCNNIYYTSLSPFIDFHFENILSLVMFLDFLVEIEFVPTTLKKTAFIS